jgi:hypothetical protein
MNTPNRARKSFRFGTLAAAAIVAAMAGPSMGAAIAAANYDSVDEGVLDRGPMTSDFRSAPSTRFPTGRDIGDLTSQVFQNEATGLYTYELTVTAGVNDISEFNTGFAPAGFNGVAGWSFSDAATAGANGDSTDVTVTVDSNGTIDWEINLVDGDAWFDAGESITFFFQSTLPPTAIDDYSVINSEVGTAQGFAPGEGGGQEPIPAPAAFPAGLALLGLCGALRRRRLA